MSKDKEVVNQNEFETKFAYSVKEIYKHFSTLFPFSSYLKRWFSNRVTWFELNEHDDYLVQIDDKNKVVDYFVTENAAKKICDPTFLNNKNYNKTLKDGEFISMEEVLKNCKRIISDQKQINTQKTTFVPLVSKNKTQQFLKEKPEYTEEIKMFFRTAFHKEVSDILSSEQFEVTYNQDNLDIKFIVYGQGASFLNQTWLNLQQVYEIVKRDADFDKVFSSYSHFLVRVLRLTKNLGLKDGVDFIPYVLEKPWTARHQVKQCLVTFKTAIDLLATNNGFSGAIALRNKLYEMALDPKVRDKVKHIESSQIESYVVDIQEHKQEALPLVNDNYRNLPTLQPTMLKTYLETYYKNMQNIFNNLVGVINSLSEQNNLVLNAICESLKNNKQVNNVLHQVKSLPEADVEVLKEYMSKLEDRILDLNDEVVILKKEIIHRDVAQSGYFSQFPEKIVQNMPTKGLPEKTLWGGAIVDLLMGDKNESIAEKAKLEFKFEGAIDTKVYKLAMRNRVLYYNIYKKYCAEKGIELKKVSILRTQTPTNIQEWRTQTAYPIDFRYEVFNRYMREKTKVVTDIMKSKQETQKSLFDDSESVH